MNKKSNLCSSFNLFQDINKAVSKNKVLRNKYFVFLQENRYNSLVTRLRCVVFLDIWKTKEILYACYLIFKVKSTMFLFFRKFFKIVNRLVIREDNNSCKSLEDRQVGVKFLFANTAID